MTRNLSTSIQTGRDEHCPMRCQVDGGDLANVVLGSDDHTIELLLNAEGLRRLAEISAKGVSDLDNDMDNA